MRQKLKAYPPLARWRILCERVGRSTHPMGRDTHGSMDALSSAAALRDTNERVSRDGRNPPGRSF